jgi:hypothetical protein
VNDKGRYRQPSATAPSETFSGSVACDRNSKSIIHRTLKLLFASDVPLRCLHGSVAKQKLNLFQFASAINFIANVVGHQ